VNGVPIQVLLGPLVGLLFVLYYVFRRKAVTSGLAADHKSYEAGVLATRLGMTQTAGSPTYNLFVPHDDPQLRRGPGDKQPVHLEIAMHGSQDGVATRLDYLYRIEQETGFASVERKIWFDCRMTAAARAPFPPFEVWTRQAPAGPIVPELALPSAATGDPAVDATYAIATAEPALSRLLAGHLARLSGFANAGVHLVGDGKKVAFVMQQQRAPLVGSALYHAEAMQQALVALAKAVGG
jgi:hypothetical protein